MSSPDRLPAPSFLKAVFDALGAGIYVTDAEGRVTAANPWAQRILGRSEDETRGHDLHDLLHRDADGRPVPREECRVLEVLADGRPAEGSNDYYLRADGTVTPIIWAATALMQDDRVAGAVIVFHDFTLHRETAERTAAHLAALEELTGRMSTVAGISTVLVSTLDIPEMLRRLVRLLVPELADWAAADLIQPEGTQEVQRLAVHSWHDHEAAQSLEGPLPPLPTRSAGVLSRVLRHAENVLLDAADLAGQPDSPFAQAHRELFDHLGGHSAVVVPLYTRRKVYGALTVARTAGSPAYTEADVLVLADIGRRAGLVMDNALLFYQQRHVAETMQRQLLTPLPQINRLRMAARYRPAQSAAEIGGDWYDSFLLADGVTTMVIGDVAGHDLQAAAHMAEVRNMLRALAWDRQEPPSLIMRRLDEAMTHTSDAPMATAILARIEGPPGGPWRMHWVNAGHPPPLLVTDDGHARFLEEGHGPLLGMTSALHLGLNWPDARVELPPRSTLLLYTDGLVESRSRPIDTGLALLRRHASALARREVEDFCDELLSRIDPSGDDVALLALRLPSAGEGAEDEEPQPPHPAHSPAADDRAAPGSRVEYTPVRNADDEVRREP
ncbi:SpoIIE family protein phosphatase [Streptomyces sp. ISL-10]|uniref:SpoIIE family protein phosphatase n=1 Tax=Streptomyces sp. ISL-10 TaxID=2819172 RepID=UPI001BE8C61B|nr:SpoIIE family protein phosphatase [Streptomyces sp. ISL-10]MBT2365962.1 SpoIIE family protein phosphatase [Streptomyces sp. ISL-10]